MHMFTSCTISNHVAYNPPHHITQYWVFQSSHVERRITFPNLISSTWLLCMFISNGLTSPKWSPAWPTPRLKLSYLVTIFSIWLKMGLCADTGYVQSVSFSRIYFTSILLKSGVIFCGITLISDGVLSTQELWVKFNTSRRFHLLVDGIRVRVGNKKRIRTDCLY